MAKPLDPVTEQVLARLLVDFRITVDTGPNYWRDIDGTLNGVAFFFRHRGASWYIAIGPVSEWGETDYPITDGLTFCRDLLIDRLWTPRQK